MSNFKMFCHVDLMQYGKTNTSWLKDYGDINFILLIYLFLLLRLFFIFPQKHMLWEDSVYGPPDGQPRGSTLSIWILNPHCAIIDGTPVPRNGRFECLWGAKLCWTFLVAFFDPVLNRCSGLGKSDLNFWTYMVIAKAAMHVYTSEFTCKVNPGSVQKPQ